jgi:hypothetical protein
MANTESLTRFEQKNLESARVEELIPVQFRKNTQTFSAFLEDYYRFLNSRDNPSYVIDRIISEHNIDSVVDSKFLDKISFEIAQGVPESPYVQKAFLLKRIIDYYNIRGSKESVLFFFRVFFNEEVTTTYPWDRVLFTSDGRWKFSRKMKLIPIRGTANDLVGQTIQQVNQLGNVVSQANVLNAVEYKFNERSFFEVEFSSDAIFGDFDFDAEVRTQDQSFRGLVYRSLTDIEVVDRGSNYEVNDYIFLEGFENTSPSAFVSKVGANGQLLGVQINSYGNSQELHYSETFVPGPESDGKKVYFNGIADVRFFNGELDFTTVNGIELFDESVFTFQVYDGKRVDVSGTYDHANTRLLLDSIFIDDETLTLHDFVYYNNPESFNLENIEVDENEDIALTILDPVSEIGAGDLISLQNINDTGDLISFLQTQQLFVGTVTDVGDGKKRFLIYSDSSLNTKIKATNFDDTESFNLSGSPSVSGPLPPISFDDSLRTLENAVIKSTNGTGASLGFQFGSFYTLDGFYENTRGRTSSDIVLQDSFFFQTFSYLIRSTLSISDWKPPFDDLVHPSGFEVFNEINNESLLQTGQDIDGEISVFAYIPPKINVIETTTVQTQASMLTQNYTSDAYFLEDYTGSQYSSEQLPAVAGTTSTIEVYSSDLQAEAEFVEPSEPDSPPAQFF